MDLVHKINTLKSRPPEYWVNTATHYLPGWSTGLLVIALAWYTAKIFWLLLPQTDEFDWSVRSPVISSTPQSSSASSVDFGAIADAHLFGVPGAEPEVQATTINAPETQLNLKLRGTVAADDPGMAHAIIADGQGKDDVYFLKDKLPGGAILYEVHPDKVILNRSGSLETLKLPKLAESLGNQQPSRPTASRSARPARGSLGNALRTNETTFTDILRPQPYMPNGELKGYRIYPGRDRRKFAALGFRPGDLVTELNGQALNNLQSGMEVFKDIASATQLTVTIDRAGQPVTISIDSNQLNSDTGNTQ